MKKNKNERYKTINDCSHSIVRSDRLRAITKSFFSNLKKTMVYTELTIFSNEFFKNSSVFTKKRFLMCKVFYCTNFLNEFFLNKRNGT